MGLVRLDYTERGAPRLAAGSTDMNEQCKHQQDAARCCACLTERFRAFEESGRRQREQRLAAIYGIKTYQSKTIGFVTIPDR